MENIVDKVFPYVHQDPEAKLEKFANNSETNNKLHPLLLDTVLHCLFGYLQQEDLKTSRFVCSNWKDASEYFFRRSSKIVFDISSPDSDDQTSAENTKDYFVSKLAEFNEIFPPEDDFTRLLTSFQFRGDISLCGLTDFLNLDDIRQNVQSLSFENLQLINAKFSCKPTDDTICKLLPRNLNKLHIEFDRGTKFGHCRTRLIISLSLLQNVDSVFLKECTVDINSKISPKELTLASLTFVKNDKEVEDIVVVNDFVNFRRIKKLSLESDNMQVKLNDNIAVATLEINQGDVFQWEDSQWKVNKLVLTKFPFARRNRMEIKELELEFAKVDLSCLPDSIERLIVTVHTYIITCNPPVSLPNLKYLQLWSENIPCHSHFSNCANLTDLELEESDGQILDLNRIPRSVQRIKLNGKIDLIGNGIYNIDTLIMYRYRLRYVDKVLKKINPRNVIIRVCFPKPFSLSKHDEMEIVKLLKKGYQSVTIGPFVWENDSQFHNSLLFNWANKPSTYYQFNHNSAVGNEIETHNFEKLCTF